MKTLISLFALSAAVAAAAPTTVAPTTGNTQPPAVNSQPPKFATQPPAVNSQPPSPNSQPPAVNSQPPSPNTPPPAVNSQPPSGATPANPNNHVIQPGPNQSVQQQFQQPVGNQLPANQTPIGTNNLRGMNTNPTNGAFMTTNWNRPYGTNLPGWRTNVPGWRTNWPGSTNVMPKR